MSSSDKPLGITLIAIIFIIAGVAFIGVGGIFLVAFQMLWGMLVTIPVIGPMVAPMGALLTPYTAILGIVLIVIAVLYIIAAVGCFMLKPWGHTLALIGSIPAIIVILGIIFLWYLTLDDTKTAFGKY